MICWCFCRSWRCSWERLPRWRCCRWRCSRCSTGRRCRNRKWRPNCRSQWYPQMWALRNLDSLLWMGNKVEGSVMFGDLFTCICICICILIFICICNILTWCSCSTKTVASFLLWLTRYAAAVSLVLKLRHLFYYDWLTFCFVHEVLQLFDTEVGEAGHRGEKHGTHDKHCSTNLKVAKNEVGGFGMVLGKID